MTMIYIFLILFLLARTVCDVNRTLVSDYNLEPAAGEQRDGSPRGAHVAVSVQACVELCCLLECFMYCSIKRILVLDHIQLTLF